MYQLNIFLLFLIVTFQWIICKYLSIFKFEVNDSTAGDENNNYRKVREACTFKLS